MNSEQKKLDKEYSDKFYWLVDGEYVNLDYYTSETINLDGHFSVAELRRIADLLEEYLEKMDSLRVYN